MTVTSPWPRIVAEALRTVPRPLATVTARARWRSLDEVAAVMRASTQPDRSTAVPPPFLRAQQRDAWRRVIAALDGWGGALLAEPVGAGKTWIALAAAARERRPAVAVVPAILQQQWEDAAQRASVRLSCWSHERASRGRVPPGAPELVIVDEAHRFRDPASRRVRTLAPWLSGRRVLLLTATPIINRVSDLVTLLRLVLPEDALALDGVERLGDLEAMPAPPRCLARVVVRSAQQSTPAFPHRHRALPTDEAEEERGRRALAALSLLALSRVPAVRRLLQSVLLDAAASSDAAFRAALGRYRALLLQCRDAGSASRALLQHFAGEGLDQLVMWDVVAPDRGGSDLVVDDLEPLGEILASPPDVDRWTDGVLAVSADERPTVCFARHRATAALLRHACGDNTAWVAGGAAGIGPHRLARAQVLRAFGPTRNTWRARVAVPHTLIATDVAAEGLDLQAAGRIIHVDLPWTAARLDQREGRLLRPGQAHELVDVLIRGVPQTIERALRQTGRIARKRTLADVWLAALSVAEVPARPRVEQTLIAGIADGGPAADVVLVEVIRDGRVGVRWLSRRGAEPWSDDEQRAVAFLKRVEAGGDAVRVRDMAAPLQSARLNALRVFTTPGPAAFPTLIRRIQLLARRASRAREADALVRLDRLLRYAAASPMLGDRLRLETLANASDAAVMAADVPDRPRPGPIVVRVVAAVSVPAPSRYVPACPPSRRSSLTSTAPSLTPST